MRKCFLFIFFLRCQWVLVILRVLSLHESKKSKRVGCTGLLADRQPKKKKKCGKRKSRTQFVANQNKNTAFPISFSTFDDSVFFTDPDNIKLELAYIPNGH